MRGGDVRTDDNVCFETRDLCSSHKRYMKYWVAHCREYYIFVFYPSMVIAPPLLGLNLLYCGSWNSSVCRLCNLALTLDVSRPDNWKIWCYWIAKFMPYCRPKRWWICRVSAVCDALFQLLWSPYRIGQTIIFSSCFFLSFFFLLFYFLA